jgi:hypothetical protein
MRPDLIDGVERNKQHPQTFEIPTDEQKDNVFADDFVKIGVEGERFWVRVTIRDGAHYVGQIKSYLVGKWGLKFDDEIAFEAKHILAVANKLRVVK